MYFDPGRYDSFLGKYKFTIPAAIFIAAGLFVCVVGFCGCWGAIHESKCMLGTVSKMIACSFLLVALPELSLDATVKPVFRHHSPAPQKGVN